jgi:hypothetical protein
VIEYVLLLIIAITLASLIVRTMVGSGQDNPGIVVRSWMAIITEIGKDHPDALKQ